MHHSGNSSLLEPEHRFLEADRENRPPLTLTSTPLHDCDKRAFQADASSSESATPSVSTIDPTSITLGLETTLEEEDTTCRVLGEMQPMSQSEMELYDESQQDELDESLTLSVSYIFSHDIADTLPMHQSQRKPLNF